MSRRDDTVPMRHMLDHAREVVAMVGGRTRRDLDTDRMFQLALTRLMEIVGEAANRVTAAGRERYPRDSVGGAVQPTMPPCARIISSVACLNSGNSSRSRPR